MEISALFGLIGLSVVLIFLKLKSALAFNDSEEKLRAGYTQARASAVVSPDASSVIYKLQGTAQLPAFSVDGDYVIGGVFSIHNYMATVKHNYTTMPAPLSCTGRLVKM